MSRKNYRFVVGTRPEVIKTVPVIVKFVEENCNVGVVFSPQHDYVFKIFCSFVSKFYSREILDKIDFLFSDRNEYEKVLNQGLSVRYAKLLDCISEVILSENEEPIDMLFVQGDTSTALAGAVFGSQNKIPVAHIEAGLRTYDKEPFPEEQNRQAISRLATLHFCPTEEDKGHLYSEHVYSGAYVTGNTVVDMLLRCMQVNKLRIEDGWVVPITVHRTENKENLLKIFDVILEISKEMEDYEFVWFPHPYIQPPTIDRRSHKNVTIAPSIEYEGFIATLCKCACVITDSGGIQEECCYLGKKNFVLRNYTERPNKFTELMGNSNSLNFKELKDKIVDFLRSRKTLSSEGRDRFGLGKAAESIVTLSKAYRI